MFRRAAKRESTPTVNVLLKVEAYTDLKGNPEGTPKAAVVGTRLDNDEKVIISLTTQGESASNPNRNSLESFSKKSSLHHVSVGGLMKLNQVMFNGEEINGMKHGLSRWAEFFEKNAEQAQRNVWRGMVCMTVGTKNQDGHDVHFGFINRISGRVVPVKEELGGIDAYVTKAVMTATASGAKARPILRAVDPDGMILDYAEVTQRAVKEGDKYRNETPEEVLARMHADDAAKNCLKLAAEGCALEMINVQSNAISSKVMNMGKGKAYLGLANAYNDEQHSYALDTYIRMTDNEDYHNLVANVAPVSRERIDPLLVPSAMFEKLDYHPALLEFLKQQENVEARAPAVDQQDAHPEPQPDNLPGHLTEPPHDGYEDIPGFD